MKNTEFIGFKINKKKKQALDECAAQLGVTRSAALNLAINKWLEEVKEKNK